MLYVISGCSCGGKTTLLKILASRGYSTSDEPGRDVVRKELDGGGRALPWKNPVAFAIKCVELSVQRYDSARRLGRTVFFDRSLIDAVSALVYEEPDYAEQYLRLVDEYRYANTVFMASPWPEHFESDAERKHTFEDAVAEYKRLVTSYTMADYSIQTLPQVSVHDRTDFILEHIA